MHSLTLVILHVPSWRSCPSHRFSMTFQASTETTTSPDLLFSTKFSNRSNNSNHFSSFQKLNSQFKSHFRPICVLFSSNQMIQSKQISWLYYCEFVSLQLTRIMKLAKHTSSRKKLPIIISPTKMQSIDFTTPYPDMQGQLNIFGRFIEVHFRLNFQTALNCGGKKCFFYKKSFAIVERQKLPALRVNIWSDSCWRLLPNATISASPANLQV